MSEKMIDVTRRLVNLILKYPHWGEVKSLTEEEIRVLADIVAAAGFEEKKLVLGRLHGHYMDQDGSRTGETYSINQVCPMKVTDTSDKDDYYATGWLDCAFRYVISEAKNYGEDLEKLAYLIALQIRASIPLAPIRLNAEGDFLRELNHQAPSILAGPYGYFARRLRDEDEIGSHDVGVHKSCGGFMDVITAATERNAICCRRCYLRVYFSKNVKTYGDLRRELALLAGQS